MLSVPPPSLHSSGGGVSSPTRPLGRRAPCPAPTCSSGGSSSSSVPSGKTVQEEDEQGAASAGVLDLDPIAEMVA